LAQRLIRIIVNVELLNNLALREP
jgi:hypothetical protein